MIYLIQDCYKDDNGYHDILKIGYSDQEFEESRGKEYNTHNFGYKLLNEREGDRALEAYLHRYFNKYRLSREWFEYSEEIIDKFLSIDVPDEDDDNENRPIILCPRTDYLKTVYRRRIIDPDFLIGTDDSIERRISKSLSIAEDFWNYISENGDIKAEEKIIEKADTTNSLLNAISRATEEERPRLIRAFSGLDRFSYLCFILDEKPGEYKAIFDEGKYKIEKLALEIFRLETLKI